MYTELPLQSPIRSKWLVRADQAHWPGYQTLSIQRINLSLVHYIQQRSGYLLGPVSVPAPQISTCSFNICREKRPEKNTLQTCFPSQLGSSQSNSLVRVTVRQLSLRRTRWICFQSLFRRSGPGILAKTGTFCENFASFIFWARSACQKGLVLIYTARVCTISTLPIRNFTRSAAACAHRMRTERETWHFPRFLESDSGRRSCLGSSPSRSHNFVSLYLLARFEPSSYSQHSPGLV